MTNNPEGFGADVGGLRSIRAAVETQHDCLATLRQLVWVVERSEGETVWDGRVVVFNLIDHPTSEIAYAWSDPVPGPGRQRFHTVLHAGPVDSPGKAVRAALQ